MCIYKAPAYFILYFMSCYVIMSPATQCHFCISFSQCPCVKWSLPILGSIHQYLNNVRVVLSKVGMYTLESGYTGGEESQLTPGVKMLPM